MNTTEIRRDFLKQVEQAVCTDRTQSHGQPEDNFNNIATLWTAWVRGRYKVDITLDRIDVGYMSILLKTARAMSNPRYLDHALDTAGYAACIAGILGAEPKLEAPVSPRPSQEKEFKPTHVHRSKGHQVQLGARGDGLVTYFGADGLAWSISNSGFDNFYKPLDEPPAPPQPSPEKEFKPTHVLRSEPAVAVELLARSDTRASYRHANSGPVIRPIAEFDRQFEPIPPQPSPEKEFKPTHQHRTTGILVRREAEVDGMITFSCEMGVVYAATVFEFDSRYKLLS